MKLKFLYTLSLLLCLGTFASSNENIRHSCPPEAKAGNKPAVMVPACRATTQESARVTDEDSREAADNYSLTLIKLLYI
jgi:hypothetical protein